MVSSTKLPVTVKTRIGYDNVEDYQSIYDLVDKLDKLSLQKKRQLTIPLIKEII